MTICTASATRFLQAGRLAVIGASTERSNFGRTVLRELLLHGCDAVAVNPAAFAAGTTKVEGVPCYATIEDVPAPVEGAIVMVGADRSAAVVQACADAGVPRVWLFRGIGSAGAVSDEALRACDERHLEVVAGACPLMFLEPAGMVHRIHRAARRATGAVDRCTHGEHVAS
jgi:acyl-CoA synthetase (NDP forming)